MWDHDVGWGGWIIMAVGMAGVWVLIALLVVGLIRSDGRSGSEASSPREILGRRLARGEIDIEEYQRRLDALGHPER
jgi:putative membrane protein